MEVNLYILIGIILVSLIVQYIVEAIKGLISAVYKYKNLKDTINKMLAPFIALVWSIALCILSNCDLFIAFGYPLIVPYVGEVATGIIASLGAGKVYDLIMNVKDYKEKLAVEKSEKEENLNIIDL